jgi:hypothetical protein
MAKVIGGATAVVSSQLRTLKFPRLQSNDLNLHPRLTLEVRRARDEASKKEIRNSSRPTLEPDGGAQTIEGYNHEVLVGLLSARAALYARAWTEMA